MRRFFRLERIFIAQYLKQLMEYKGDFLVGVVGVFLEQALNILFIAVIFTQIPDLKGWTMTQIIFIYGFSLIPKGIDHVLTDNLWAVGQRLIKRGEFDKYMTRPINPLLYVILEVFQVDGFGELLVGILLLIRSAYAVTWNPLKITLLIVVIPFATVIYTAMKIAAASLAFWLKQSGSLLYIFYQVNDFAKYPVSIYNGGMKFILSYVIPFAFTAYYPASYFLTGRNPLFNIGGTVIAAVVALSIALFVWSKGISAYESAGS